MKRTIIIDELDQGFKVTTDVRWSDTTLDGPESRNKNVRKELAVPKLANVMKIVKMYLSADLEEEKEK